MIAGCRDLTVRFGDRMALEAVTMEAPSGQISAVVGGDGDGKSTLLRTLVGRLRPTAGSVTRPPRSRIGYVPAGSGVYPDLTAAENLSFAGRAFGMRGEALREAIDGVLARTGLGAARDRLGGLLSGGMRQKLALGMALLHQPDLLVLDEPTTGLDPMSRAELWQALSAATVRGAAVVLSTTYLDEADRARTALVLDRGRVLVRGTPEDIVAGIPGRVLRWQERPTRVDEAETWRRGTGWRSWSRDGSVPPAPLPSSPIFRTR